MFKGYFKPTPDKLLRISLALRLLVGTISGASYFDGNKDAAFWFLVAGAVIEFFIQCQTPSDNNRPPYIQKMLLLVLGCSFLFCACNRKTYDHLETSKTDSSWTTKQPVNVPVKGGATPGVNMDSVKRLLDWYMINQGKNGVPQMVYVDKPFAVPDTSGMYELRYWMDATGQLFAQCVGKDQVISTLVDQNNRLVKESSKQVIERVKEKVPKWAWWTMGVMALLLIGPVIIWGKKLFKNLKSFWG